MTPCVSTVSLARGAVASILGTGMVLIVVAFGIAGRFDLGPAFRFRVLAAYSLVAVLVFVHLDSHRPCHRFGPANQVTLLRAALVALLVGLVGEASSPALACSAVGVGLLASVLDGVDGWLARRGGVSSRFGARFDMETDALLIAVLALLVWQHGKAGPWVLLVGLMRYGFLGAGMLLPWMRRALPFSRRRQTVCVLQILTLLASLLPILAVPWSNMVAAFGLAVLLWSFALDCRWLAHPDPRLDC